MSRGFLLFSVAIVAAYILWVWLEPAIHVGVAPP
jgi:hypothetical protein